MGRKRNVWTADRIKYIRKWNGVKPISTIASELGTSKASLRSAINHYKIGPSRKLGPFPMYTPELCTRLGVTARTARKWVNAKRIPYKNGYQGDVAVLVFDAKAIEAWIPLPMSRILIGETVTDHWWRILLDEAREEHQPWIACVEASQKYYISRQGIRKHVLRGRVRNFKSRRKLYVWEDDVKKIISGRP